MYVITMYIRENTFS